MRYYYDDRAVMVDEKGKSRSGILTVRKQDYTFSSYMGGAAQPIDFMSAVIKEETCTVKGLFSKKELPGFRITDKNGCSPLFSTDSMYITRLKKDFEKDTLECRRKGFVPEDGQEEEENSAISRLLSGKAGEAAKGSWSAVEQAEAEAVSRVALSVAVRDTIKQHNAKCADSSTKTAFANVAMLGGSVLTAAAVMAVTGEADKKDSADSPVGVIGPTALKTLIRCKLASCKASTEYSDCVFSIGGELTGTFRIPSYDLPKHVAPEGSDGFLLSINDQAFSFFPTRFYKPDRESEAMMENHL